jgi:hypothetical protein
MYFQSVKIKEDSSVRLIPFSGDDRLLKLSSIPRPLNGMINLEIERVTRNSLQLRSR